MKKPNYGFEKRKREMRKAKRQEEKRLKKLNKGEAQPGDEFETVMTAGPITDAPQLPPEDNV